MALNRVDLDSNFCLEVSRLLSEIASSCAPLLDGSATAHVQMPGHDIGDFADHARNQIRSGIRANLRFHFKVSLVASFEFFDRGITLPVFVLGQAWCREQIGIH